MLWAPELSRNQIIAGYAEASDDPSTGDFWSTRLVGSTDEFCDRFDALASVMLDNPAMFGYCYFQLYDTYQERLGIYRFDRTPKFDLERIHAIQSRPAAFEQPPRDSSASQTLGQGVTSS
jgi:beta-glucuronidase